MIINPSDATYQLEMSCHNLKKNSWLGFSEVESKPAVLSEVNRKVKAKSSTVDNARTKAATQRPQKPLQQKGKLSHLILWITHILKKVGNFCKEGQFCACLCGWDWSKVKKYLWNWIIDAMTCDFAQFRYFNPLHPYISSHLLLTFLIIYLFWYWQGEFFSPIKASKVSNHFFCSHGVNDWFSSITLNEVKCNLMELTTKIISVLQ